LTGNVLANDSDPEGDVLTAVLVTGPQHGTLTFNPDGSFTYTPNANFSGIDSFTYQSTDGTLASAPIVVQMTVTLTGGPLPPDDTSDDSDDDSDSDSGGEDSQEEDPDGDSGTSDDLGSDPGALDSPFRPTSNGGVRERRGEDATVDIVVQAESPQRAVSAESTQAVEATTTLLSSLKGARRIATAAERIAAEAIADVIDADGHQLNIALVELRNDVESAAQMGTYIAGSVAIASAATSAGYALWALRSAHFVTSFLATIPAWRRFDPLPLINSPVVKRRDEGESLTEIAMGNAPAATAPMEGSP
jgi:VCBS repeat-containing protein